MVCRPIRYAAVFAALLWALTGCGHKGIAGHFQARGLGTDPVVLDSEYRIGYYAHGIGSETSFVCGDVSAKALLNGTVSEAQVLHVEVLWQPRPGTTPIDSTATNASIRYILITGGEVGVYEGGGFVMPSGVLGDAVIKIKIKQATLRLVESTPGFRDLLSPAILTGQLRAVHDRPNTRRLHYAISQYVTNALGRSTLVMRGDEIDGPADPLVGNETSPAPGAGLAMVGILPATRPRP
jgi:hypothetical protein